MPDAVGHRVPVTSPSGVVSPAPDAPSDAPPDVSCVPVTDCRIVAQHRLGSPFARAHGFYRSRAGLVASRHPDWRAHGRPEETVFVEVTGSCAVWTNFYIVSEGEVWLPFPQSCGPSTCADSTGFYFGPIESAHARAFRPLGHGFFDDGAQVFHQDEPLRDDPPVDRATFYVCVIPPDDASSARFHPVAEDAHGVFEWGDCGSLIRVRR